MSVARRELQEALCCYITETLSYMDTVRGFCEGLSKWMIWRETELNMMIDIKDRKDNISLNINHVTKSENKGQAFMQYMKSKVTQVTADSMCAELEKELTEVLKDTLQGLKKLHCFLDAVEKLAVTSLHVFTESQVLHLPREISLEHVQLVIIAARLICPLLLEFKRDPEAFFLPRLQNVEALSYRLDKYIRTTQRICDGFTKSSSSEFSLNMSVNTVIDLDVDLSEDDTQRMLDHINQLDEIRLQNVEALSYRLDKIRTTQRICDGFTKSSSSEFSLNMSVNTVIDLDVDLSEDDTQRMLDHINQLDEIRMNQAFRMVFLFQDEPCSGFINEFSERQPRMLQFLTELEETAVQLDRMNKGAKISSVAGSSVGAVGGVLSIIGLALIPVTAGVSLALTVTGLGLGITSGVNSLVTTATECGVNYTQQKRASEVFQSFMEDVQTLQDCLEETMKRDTNEVDVAVGTGKMLIKLGVVGKTIDTLIDAGKVVAQEGKVLRNVPRVASDIPDIGQAALKGPLALTKSARAGLVVANALFLGMDIFFICKDSISLAKGTEAEMSRAIRARAEIWSSEIDSWQKIHDLFNEGLLKSEKNKALLETPFYKEMEEKKDIRAETEEGAASEEDDGKHKEKTFCIIQ